MVSEMRKALTPRQIEVMDEVATGATNAEVGERLFIAADTVKSLLRGAAQALSMPGVNRTTLVARWLREEHAAQVYAARVPLHEAHRRAVSAGREDIAALVAQAIGDLTA